jgi:hypothetical protein
MKFDQNNNQSTKKENTMQIIHHLIKLLKKKIKNHNEA